MPILCCLCLLSCGGDPVTVSKEPMKVDYRFIEDEPNKKRIPVTKDEEAATLWQFGCKTDFDFDVVERTQLGNNDWLVTIKIRRVHLTLTAPVVIWISKTAAPEVVQHEEAHVEICRRIYDKVNSEALKAGNAVVTKEYQASAPTVEKACKLCIERAAEDVYTRYHSAATYAINRVSSIFDDLERDKKQHEKPLIDEAFSKYRRTENR